MADSKKCSWVAFFCLVFFGLVSGKAIFLIFIEHEQTMGLIADHWCNRIIRMSRTSRAGLLKMKIVCKCWDFSKNVIS